MSVTVSYFFNSEKSLAELATEINGWLGCSLSPYEGDLEDLYDRFLGMEFTLRSASGYENDRELDLENFSYELDFRVPWPDAPAEPIQLPAMAMVVYALHHRMGLAGILVHDAQTLLARYEEREVPGYGRRLYDIISGTPFIGFSEHLAILQQRLPDRGTRYPSDEEESAV